MKKILYITILLSILSCSPQRQLAKLLERHPELHRDSVIKIDTFYITKAEQNSVQFTINDLLALSGDSISNAPDSAENYYQSKNSISAETSGCNANITANADGSFNLNIKQKPDTIHIIDTLDIPVYITNTEYKDKIVFEMTKWQAFFYKIGTTFIFTLVLLLIIFITSRILKHYKIT